MRNSDKKQIWHQTKCLTIESGLNHRSSDRAMKFVWATKRAWAMKLVYAAEKNTHRLKHILEIDEKKNNEIASIKKSSVEWNDTFQLQPKKKLTALSSNWAWFKLLGFDVWPTSILKQRGGSENPENSFTSNSLQNYMFSNEMKRAIFNCYPNGREQNRRNVVYICATKFFFITRT